MFLKHVKQEQLNCFQGLNNISLSETLRNFGNNFCIQNKKPNKTNREFEDGEKNCQQGGTSYSFWRFVGGNKKNIS